MLNSITEDIFDTAPCGYFSFFDNGIIGVVNETLCCDLKYKKVDLTGRNVEMIFTLPSRIFYQTHFFPLLRMHGHAEEIFLSLLTSEGKYLPVLVNANCRQTEQGMLTCCAYIVVENRKKFEDELVAARKAAETALAENSELVKIKSELQLHTEKLDQQIHMVNQQNDELKEFSHVVTHNLKEPLRKILMFTSRLQMTEKNEILSKLLSSAEQMKEVVVGLQQFVWLNEKKDNFALTDLNEVLKNAVYELSREKQADLLELHSEQLPQLDADGEQIQLLFYHLLSNAVKFRKSEKALVTIKATVLKRNSFRAASDRYSYEDYIKLEVIDEGTGFDANYKEHIFELFRKLQYNDGHGLGLALCKRIAYNHSGSIEADSQPGKFTKITVWLRQRQPEKQPGS